MHTLSIIAQTIGWISVLYLVVRTYGFASRQARSYRALPYPSKNFEARLTSPHPDRVRAMLLGVALGDALGLARESLPVRVADLRFGRRATIARGIFRWMRRRGTVSDDTQLTLALSQCLTSDGFDEATWEAALHRWWPMRIGAGHATSGAVKRSLRGVHPSGDAESEGNGAAMRVASLAAFPDEAQRLEWLRLQALPTHRADEAIAGAEVVLRVLRWCLEHDLAALDPDVLIRAAIPHQWSKKIDDWRTRLERTSSETLEDIGASGWVFESVPAAVHLLLRWRDDINGGVEALYRVGGDVDTIASMYCSFVGALCGVRALDARLLGQIQGTEALLEEADRLMNVIEEARPR